MRYCLSALGLLLAARFVAYGPSVSELTPAQDHLTANGRVPIGWSLGPREADTIVVGGNPVCAQCRIVTRAVAVLGDAEPPRLNPLALSLIRLDNGKTLTTGLGDNSDIALFHQNGRLERIIGRLGNGPGEYIQPIRVTRGASDSIYVIDAGTRRISILSGQGDFVRSIATPEIAAQDLIELGDGSVVLTGIATSREGVGHALHRLDVQRKAFSPIGAAVKVYDPKTSIDLIRRLTTSAHSFFWAANGQYVIERRASTGRVVKVLARNEGWFLAARRSPPGADKPPKPVLSRIAEDSAGRLWVFITVASAAWKPLPLGAPLPGSKTGERNSPSVLDRWRNRDTVIEVLDPDRGLLIASVRLSGLLLHSAAPFPFVARIENGRDDSPVVRVLEIALQSEK